MAHCTLTLFWGLTPGTHSVGFQCECVGTVCTRVNMRVGTFWLVTRVLGASKLTSKSGFCPVVLEAESFYACCPTCPILVRRALQVHRVRQRFDAVSGNRNGFHDGGRILVQLRPASRTVDAQACSVTADCTCTAGDTLFCKPPIPLCLPW